ncbi:hypothetical protein GOB13_19820 [Sinorhizobium meliloti]|nr:hypothetical protein [Sinorhizobium meliloti]MDX0083553.1 hypothetical protein [Sinorhizobium meliloti]
MSQKSSSAASAARESSSSPRAWSGWIPVTGTGMRKKGLKARRRRRPARQGAERVRTVRGRSLP